MRAFAVAIVGVVLASCMPPTVLRVSPAPNEVEAARALLASGTGMIKGSALMRQRSGEVVTCAGNEVYLVPATTSITQQLTGIFGSGNGYLRHGGHETLGGGNVLAPIEPNRSTLCNAQGFFTFDNVQAGRWHVITTIIWSAGEYYQGGALLQTIDLEEGKEIEIVLST